MSSCGESVGRKTKEKDREKEAEAPTDTAPQLIYAIQALKSSLDEMKTFKSSLENRLEQERSENAKQIKLLEKKLLEQKQEETLKSNRGEKLKEPAPSSSDSDEGIKALKIAIAKKRKEKKRLRMELELELAEEELEAEKLLAKGNRQKESKPRTSWTPDEKLLSQQQQFRSADSFSSPISSFSNKDLQRHNGMYDDMQQLNHELELELARVRNKAMEREFELERDLLRQKKVASRATSRERFSF